jgi:hypothetical protein
VKVVLEIKRNHLSENKERNDFGNKQKIWAWRSYQGRERLPECVREFERQNPNQENSPVISTEQKDITSEEEMRKNVTK